MLGSDAILVSNFGSCGCVSVDARVDRYCAASAETRINWVDWGSPLSQQPWTRITVPFSISYSPLCVPFNVFKPAPSPRVNVCSGRIEPRNEKPSRRIVGIFPRQLKLISRYTHSGLVITRLQRVVFVQLPINCCHNNCKCAHSAVAVQRNTKSATSWPGRFVMWYCYGASYNYPAHPNLSINKYRG